MSKSVIRTIFYSGVILSIRAFFQRWPRWVQYTFVILSGTVFGSIISLKIYGLIFKDIVATENIYLKTYNAVISIGLFLLLSSFFSYCLYLLFIMKWISIGGKRSKSGFLGKMKGFLGKDSREAEEYKPKNLTNAPIEDVLDNADEKQLGALSKILNIEAATREAILDKMCFLAQSTARHLTRKFLKKKSDYDQVYKSLVRSVAKKLKIKHSLIETTSEIEVKISQKVIETVWEKLTPEQKKELEETLRREAEKYGKTAGVATSGSIFAALTAAQLSGFSIYILATTALGALNLSLGAGLYTALTSAISVITGPVGWIGAGLFTIWHLDKPNYKKLIPAIIYISSMRTGYK